MSASTSLEADRLAVGVLPRTALELEAMVAGCCRPAAACDDDMDDDEFLGRAVPGGVGDARISMVGAVARQPAAAPEARTEASSHATLARIQSSAVAGSRGACNARAGLARWPGVDLHPPSQAPTICRTSRAQRSAAHLTLLPPAPNWSSVPFRQSSACSLALSNQWHSAWLPIVAARRILIWHATALHCLRSSMFCLLTQGPAVINRDSPNMA